MGHKLWGYVLALVSLFSATCNAFYIPGWSMQEFDYGDRVPLFVNKVTSKNTQLPYAYYSLPFVCQPSTFARSLPLNLGQVLRSDRIQGSDYALEVGKNFGCIHLCDSKVDKNGINRAIELIKDEYMAEWIVDNLPGATPYVSTDRTKKYYTAGFPLGTIEKDKEGRETAYIYNHVNLVLYYRTVDDIDDQRAIVAFEVYPKSVNGPLGKCTENPQSPGVKRLALDPDAESMDIPFTYSVFWRTENSIDWASRWSRYFAFENDSQRIHWFAIINSLIIGILLTAVVGTIISRTLSKDFDAFSTTFEKAPLIPEEQFSGWKLLHGDVFRPPQFANILCSITAAGVQLSVTVIAVLLFSCIGVLNPSYRGGIVTFELFAFVISGIFAGVYSSRTNRSFGAGNWLINAIYTATFVPGLAMLGMLLLNMFSWAKLSSAALPFGTIIVLFCLWLLLSLPLVVAGAWWGNQKPPIEPAMRTSQIARHIPQQPWYNNVWLGVTAGGLVPFTVIFTELLYLMNSVWQDKIGFYYMFGFLTVMTIMLIITVAEVSIVSTYVQLCSEDYHWWWRAFFVGAGPAIWVFLYSVWYYLFKLKLDGFVSTVLYFGYSLIGSGLFGLLTGTVGFISSYVFVMVCYSNLKAD